MTAADLIQGLKLTGTSDAKLAAIAEMGRNPKASATEAARALEEAGVSPVTLAKAKHLAAGQPIEKLLGAPPPNSAESKETRMAQALAKELAVAMERMQEKALERAPGRLGKPT